VPPAAGGADPIVGRVALVTGASSGIGAATAVALAAEGASAVGICARRRDRLDEVLEQVRAHAPRSEAFVVDVGDLDGLPAFASRVEESLGGVDVLVNNAGTGDSSPVLEVDLATWRHVLEVDLTGAFLCAQAAARRMVAAGGGGRIVNVTSVHEHIPFAGSAPYCAAKGGLGLLTKVMALELAAHGITVNAVAPGEIATPMTGNEDVDPTSVDRPGIPARRPGDAREVAALVAFVCRDEAAYLTGESIVVDGGLRLMAAQQDRQAP
jgi:NAD(P)-dependent dehydrogenase (short-subunit alcohol dehydrogenase family)